MGARGRRPEPTALKLLHGAKPYRVNLDEPKPPIGLPECPDWVDSETMQIWNKTLLVLHHMNLASSADEDTLMAYCQAVVVHRRAARQIAEQGVTVLGSMRTPVKNPACTVMNEAATQIARYAGLFGLTPSARSEIRMGKVRGDAGDGADPSRYLTG